MLFAASDPLTGRWAVDFKASEFPPGFPALRSQSMECSGTAGRLQCRTERVTVEGAHSQSQFTAAYDGLQYAVTGAAEISSVSLHLSGNVVDADFFFRDAPVYSYRIEPSSDARSLTIISVDTKTHAPLHAKIVYRK